MANLFIVGTPIGNLNDITYRAVETLKSVDIIACEDTRQSRKLLDHYGIQKRTISCRARNEVNSSEGIVKLMDEGNNIAYVSDAGTPGISDPGSILVSRVRQAGHDVIPIPGPSAFASLISVAGVQGKTYTFEGFLPQKSGKRKKRLEELISREENFIIYESPYRIVKLLQELSEIDCERIIVLGREMTKAFEEYLVGTVNEVKFKLESKNSQKGEFSILVSGSKKA